jgi:hypothetical protein
LRAAARSPASPSYRRRRRPAAGETPPSNMTAQATPRRGGKDRTACPSTRSSKAPYRRRPSAHVSQTPAAGAAMSAPRLRAFVPTKRESDSLRAQRQLWGNARTMKEDVISPLFIITRSELSRSVIDTFPDHARTSSSLPRHGETPSRRRPVRTCPRSCRRQNSSANWCQSVVQRLPALRIAFDSERRHVAGPRRPCA